MGVTVADYRMELNPPVRMEGLDAHDAAASMSLLGQFRTSVSSWLFLRADMYLHNGVEMRTLTKAELARGKKGVGGTDDGHEKLHDDSKIVTVIPPAERDFRGVFGTIERAVSSYKDMKGHDHNDPKDAMPLFRLMTWIDPYFQQGWTVGGMILARDRSPKGTELALNYLKEGLTHNPKSIDILTQIGFYKIRRQNRLAEGVEFMERATRVGLPAFERLSEPEREALVQAYRWKGLCFRELSRAGELRKAMQEGLSIFPDDPILRRLLDQADRVEKEALGDGFEFDH
jgi:hypothetical protein